MALQADFLVGTLRKEVSLEAEAPSDVELGWLWGFVALEGSTGGLGFQILLPLLASLED